VAGNNCTSNCPFQAAAQEAFCFIIVGYRKRRDLIGYVSADFDCFPRPRKNNLRFLEFRTAKSRLIAARLWSASCGYGGTP
jgi:hypothetical protein